MADKGEYAIYRGKLWTAPELLRAPGTTRYGTQKGDIYSAAIIMQELVFRGSPFFLDTMTPKGKLCQLCSLRCNVYSLYSTRTQSPWRWVRLRYFAGVTPARALVDSTPTLPNPRPTLPDPTRDSANETQCELVEYPWSYHYLDRTVIPQTSVLYNSACIPLRYLHLHTFTKNKWRLYCKVN